MQGEGGEWRARVRSGGGLSAGAAGLEFPSKGIRRELWNSFEGNSKGTRRVLEVLRVVSGTSCNHAHGPEFGPGWLQNTVFYWDYDDRFKPSTL